VIVNPVREQPAAAPVEHRPSESALVPVLLILTFVTGLVDATTYLALGHVFAANMTGNIVLLGFALAGAGNISAAASLVSLAAFLIGSAAGGVLARNLETDRRRWVGIALGVETVGLCLAAVSAALALSGCAIVAVLALAMGVRNATVRRLGVPDLTTTVLTMTLTGLGADLLDGRRLRPALRRRIGSVLAMLIGALIGALLLNYALFAPLALAGLLLVLTTGGFLFVRRTHAS
jgi:uncharacterized membrane protein YoaK (UPF0700 family)